jgi:hypothetical protein
MTVRCEIAEPYREACVRGSGDWLRRLTSASSAESRRRQSPAVRGRSEGRARRPKARRNSGAAIVTEALMNHAG